MLITTSDALADFCAAISDAPYIAVDTEFLRERSYYAHLCLVQVAYGEHFAAIDPLAPGLDLSPLRDLLLDEDIVKVFHAASQDLEIFLDKLGRVPGPVFDTQIAASVCGLGEQPGYASLVSQMLGIEVDKASQVTDWSVRPLTDRQLDYALSDVTHLCKVYEMLVERLEKTGRGAWISEEMEALHDPSKYRTNPREAWQRIKLRRPKRRTLAVLRELAAWREEQAMERNIPRKWVQRDEVLVEISQSLPRNADDLARVRGLKDHLARGREGDDLLDAVERGLAVPEEEWPEVEVRRRKAAGHESLVSLLQTFLQIRADENGVAAAVVARKSELERIASERNPDVPALHGWRRKIFGADALELCAGRLGLTGAKGGKVEEVWLEYEE